jgi:hypothetical protein
MTDITQDIWWVISGVRIMFGCGAIFITCLFLLPFTVRYSRFSGEAAKKIHDCQKELDKMFTI